MNLTDKESEDFLRTVYIAAPCSVGWENMTGDDKVRACSLCKKNVYNTSKLTTREAANLILDNEENRICVRIYRRKDGTIMTENCPVGLRKIRDAIKFCAIFVLVALAGFGLISEAHAQGLVGAPVDGGVYRGPWPTDEAIANARSLKLAQTGLISATVLGTVLWLGRKIRQHRASIVLIATTLVILLATVGFIYDTLDPGEFITPYI